MKKQGPNREKMAVLILAMLLIIAVSYVAINDYMSVQMRKDMVIFQSGARAGYEQAVVQLFEQAMTCEPVPLFIGKLGNQTINKTISVINVDCLRQVQNVSV